ncbi:MAG TPA: helix-turn-helix transcriptional regulator [Pseudonocardiaceae bacterium]|nr:helix-turn-helix transcriptional regulator [Pseudonocardiaceae bacterium]
MVPTVRAVVNGGGLPKVFGIVVRQLRKERGLSQERLAAAAGIDRAYMGGLERGQRNPSLTTIDRIAVALDLSISEVLAAVERQRQ